MSSENTGIPTISRVHEDGTLIELLYDPQAHTTALAIAHAGGSSPSPFSTCPLGTQCGSSARCLPPAAAGSSPTISARANARDPETGGLHLSRADDADALDPVATLTIAGAIGAIIVYALVRNYTKHPARLFIWISLVVFVLSLIPDYLIIGMMTGHFAGATLSSALVLMLMHAVAGVIIVWSLVSCWKK